MEESRFNAERASAESKMSEAKKTAKRSQLEEAIEAGAPLSAQALLMVGELRRGKKGGSYEERVERLAELLGDGEGLLGKEGAETFRSSLPKGAWIGHVDVLESDRTGLDNYLGALEGEEDGQAWEIGLLALLRCKVLERADPRTVDAAVKHIIQAIEYDGARRPEGLARECFRSPAFARRAPLHPDGAGEAFASLLGDMISNGAYEQDEALQKRWRQILTDYLDVAEEIPAIRWQPGRGPRVKVEGRPKGGGPGAALMSLAQFYDDYTEPEGERICEMLHERARAWIKKGVDAPEPGEMAAACCLAIREAANSLCEVAVEQAALTLKAALASGMGVRQAEGQQPLRLLMEIGPMRTLPPGIVKAVGEAGQALIEAGARPEDLVEGVESALKNGQNQDLAERLRVRMEREELAKSLDGLSAEEAQLVREFRRAKSEAQAAPAPAGKRRAGL